MSYIETSVTTTAWTAWTVKNQMTTVTNATEFIVHRERTIIRCCYET